MFVASIGVGFAFNFSSISVMRNVMTYGAFLSFLTYSFQIFEPFKMLAQIFTDLKSAQASAERVFQILYEEDEILEEEESDLDFEGNIKFENVSFHYFDDDKLILKDFNFEIKNISLYLPFASPIIKNINKKIIKNSKNKPDTTMNISIFESIISCNIFVIVFNRKCIKIEYFIEYLHAT